MALNSKTNLKIIDAICEGPIDGLAQEHKSVFLNETLVTLKQLQDRAEDEENQADQDHPEPDLKRVMIVMTYDCVV